MSFFLFFFFFYGNPSLACSIFRFKQPSHKDHWGRDTLAKSYFLAYFVFEFDNSVKYIFQLLRPEAERVQGCGPKLLKESGTKEHRMRWKDREQKKSFKGATRRKSSNQQEAPQIGGAGIRDPGWSWGVESKEGIVVLHQIVLLQACERQLLLPYFVRWWLRSADSEGGVMMCMVCK